MTALETLPWPVIALFQISDFKIGNADKLLVVYVIVQTLYRI